MATSSDAYLSTLKTLSDRIIKAQEPIRILDAVNWDDSIRESFFRKKCRVLPPVDADYYTRKPLAFDPDTLISEFHDIERSVTRQLGQLNPVGAIMRRMCREFQTVIRMLQARGHKHFGEIAQELYGSSGDVFHAGEPTVADLGRMLEATVSGLLQADSMREEPRTLGAAEAVNILSDKLSTVFPKDKIRVMISDGITSDAAAGSDYIKLNKDATFNQRDLDVLEVHEGWVHVGTTLNGLAQPYCTFLGKGTPSTTITQEGLAVLTEIITLRSGPRRLYKLVQRVRALTLAEEGADFMEVFRYLTEQGVSPEESYTIACRAFRGSTPDGLPFTKDLAYIKGFVLTYNFIRVAVIRGMVDRIPLMFCGKVNLDDMKTLAQLREEGIVTAPAFIPPHLQDLKGLAAWLSFSRFVSSVSFEQLEKDYSQLF